MYKRTLAFILSMMIPFLLLAEGEEEETGPRFTISGYITDGSSGEELIGAAVIIDGSGS